MLKQKSGSYEKVENWLPAELYTDYPPEFLSWAKDHNITLPGLKSKRGQTLALAVYNQDCYFSREDLSNFTNCIIPLLNKDLRQGDPIQQLNKVSQFGLKHLCIRIDGEDYHNIPYPYQYDPKYIRNKYDGSSEDRDRMIDQFKAKCQSYIDIPNSQYDVGHCDRQNNDDICFQPPSYQRSRRDRFKYNPDGTQKCPTVDELTKNFDKYYPSFEEKQKIVEVLGDEYNVIPQRCRNCETHQVN